MLLSPTVPFATHRLPPASVRLLSIATMRPLRLPPPLPRSLRFPSLPESFAASRHSLTQAAGSMAQVPGRCEPGVVPFRRFEGSVRLSQLSRIPPCVFAPFSDPGPAPLHLACASRRKRLTVYSVVLPPLAQTGRPRRSANFRDSITRLRPSLHTLRAPLAGTRRNVRFRVAASLSRVGVIYPLGIVNMFHLLFIGLLMFWLLTRCAFLWQNCLG